MKDREGGSFREQEGERVRMKDREAGAAGSPGVLDAPVAAVFVAVAVIAVR